MSILVVILIGAAFYGWQSVTASTDDGELNSGDETPGATEPTRPCKEITKVRRGDRIDAADVVVNVYNAGTVPGQASATLSALEAKGFQSGVADNAPTGTRAANVTILASNRRDPEVQLVAQQFTGDVAFGDEDLAPGVDVVVGDQFQSIDTEAETFFVEKHKVTSCKGRTSAS